MAASQASVQHSIIAWLIVFVAAGVLSTYEIAGSEPCTPGAQVVCSIHTISFLSQGNLSLAVLVSGLVAAGAAVFEAWWWGWHLRRPIAK